MRGLGLLLLAASCAAKPERELVATKLALCACQSEACAAPLLRRFAELAPNVPRERAVAWAAEVVQCLATQGLHGTP